MVEYPGDVRLFVNGSYVEGAGEARQQVRSPVSGEVIGSVPVPVQADIDAAVRSVLAEAGGRRSKAKELLRHKVESNGNGKLNGSGSVIHDGAVASVPLDSTSIRPITINPTYSAMWIA